MTREENRELYLLVVFSCTNNTKFPSAQKKAKGTFNWKIIVKSVLETKFSNPKHKKGKHLIVRTS